MKEEEKWGERFANAAVALWSIASARTEQTNDNIV